MISLHHDTEESNVEDNLSKLDDSVAIAGRKAMLQRLDLSGVIVTK